MVLLPKKVALTHTDIALDDQKEPSADNQMAFHFRQILILLGEDPLREGIEKTPTRAAKAWLESTSGSCRSMDAILNGGLFPSKSTQMVVVKDIEFYSQCEHHLVPFLGRCHIGYIPEGTIIGTSKLPRIVKKHAQTLQLQERLTEQIAQALQTALTPKGIVVVMKGVHMCVKSRSIENQQSEMITSHKAGVFDDAPSKPNEFFGLLSL
ncbi:MAG: GTP cyclohydrolase I [Candidatus Marinamargulisbacteria bacterium]|jgi:GTP cyclohydrolase I